MSHRAFISWSKPAPDFLQGKYSREHTWRFDGGVTMAASSSPLVVPVPWSNPDAVDPEEAFVAALSSCHLLSFLWVAAKEGFSVERYDDEAVGAMRRNEAGVPWVSSVLLNVRIVYAGDSQPTKEQEAAMHHRAHEQCFIAASVKTTVNVRSLHFEEA